MATADSKITWQTTILPPATKRALDFLAKQPWLKKSAWYLAGGTALALQTGHRRSVDLDFFTPKNDFSQGKLIERFPKNIWETTFVQEGTIYGKLRNAKVSFIAYPFFHHRQPYLFYGSVPILDKRDVAVMKIIAISQRGTKRDFVDLYWYTLHEESFTNILERLNEQYPSVQHNYHHIYNSLLYFEDAEKDPMPQLNFKVSWKKVKEYFRREIPKITKQFLNIP